MLRNKEFSRFAIIFLSLSAILIIAGFAVNTGAGILAAASSAVFGAAFFVFTKMRYNRLAQLSKQIDLVLHNADRLELGEADEGELSILHSEIKKMTLRIREQNDTLKKDKQYLADSLADIAHQLRTPLTSANLILSLLTKNTDEQERQAFFRELEGLLMRMDWLITSLLKLSRVDAGFAEFQNEPIAVKTLAESAVRPLLIPMELRSIELHIDIPEDAVIQGDLAWLSEAVQNILKNCMESINEKGRIEIVCKENPLYTELLIHDSGRGFDAEDLPHLFDRFYRGKSTNATGYGIGLALCKMIVARQGGSIKAQNHPKGGALFAIRFQKILPLASCDLPLSD
ncbi:MAG: HAMP domain-containing histidine kinase [Oscillospiraceae bacterium]|jgi:signal transduction histidine kinase|nr:HAMP domain-containing histidine kinase [Oscillospiraceae bacterium]